MTSDITDIGTDYTHVPSVNSTITGSTSSSWRVNEQQLSTEEKKRKIDEVYSSKRWQEEDKYEANKVKVITRTNIFKHVKFIKGEGNKLATNILERKNRKDRKEYGKCHERADLTQVRGYEYTVMKLAGITEETTSFVNRALWWKTYNDHVKEEIRQMRGWMSAYVKETVNAGKLVQICYNV